MTRRKKRQPAKFGDLEVGRGDATPQAPLTTISTTATTELVNGGSVAEGGTDLKVMQNGHHLLGGVPEGDRNGNILLRAHGEGLEATGDDLSSHHLKGNCKIQLSKVDLNSAAADLIHEGYADPVSQLEGCHLNDHQSGETPCLSDCQAQGSQSGEEESPVMGDGLVTGGLPPVSGEEGEFPFIEGGSPSIDRGSPSLQGEEDGVEDPAADTENGAAVHAEDEDQMQDQKRDEDKSYSDICKDFYKRRRPMEVPDDFICQLCQRVYDNPRDLTIHIRSHNESSSHTCNICSKKLSSASSLDRHMLIHSGERPFQCRMCEMSFTTNGNMNRHMRTHDKDGATKDENGRSPLPKIAKGSPSKGGKRGYDGPPPKRAKYGPQQQQPASDNELTCPVCHKTFICRIGFETHMTFHPDMTQNCVFCNLSFRNQRGLRMHLYKVHRNDGISESDMVITEAPQDSLPKENTGLDDLCMAEFSTKNFPKIAQLWCEENSLTTNGDGVSRVCQQCNKAFPCLSSLNLHLNAAHGPKGRQSEKHKMKPKKSRKNGAINAGDARKARSPKHSFMNALSLQPIGNDRNRLQRDRTANSIKAFEKENAWLKNYMTPEVHTSGLWKGFPVIAFDQKGGDLSGRTGRPQPQSFSPLKGEMAEGMPRKPSTKLEKRLAQSEEADMGPDAEPDTGDIGVGMLTPVEFASAHSHIDAGELDEENALTDENGDTFWDAEVSGKKHSNVCKFCNKTFPFRSTLKVHVRSHMGLTPYKCMLCDYSSADKSTLVRHMRTHSGERPYSCKLCGFPFTTKANCERHVKKRHSKLSKLDIDVNIQHHPVPPLPEQGQFSSPDTVCKVCQRDFKFFRDLQNHMRVHEKSPSKVYACIKCNMNFSKKNQCVRHMLRKHRHLSSSEIQQHVQKLSRRQEKTASKNGQDNKAAKQSLAETLSTFKDMPFSSQQDLSGLPRPVPVYVNTGYQVFPTDVQEEPLDLSIPKKGVSPPLFSPDKPSTSLDQQAGGMILQEDVKRSLATLKYKDAYMKFYSPRLDALVCPHCLRLFKKGSRLKTHIRSHTKERPFRCSMCSAAFTQSLSLDEHMIKRHGDGSDDQGVEIKYGITPMQMNRIKREQLQQQVSILKSCLQPREEGSEDDRPVLQGRSGQSSPTTSQADPNAELSSISKMLAAATTTSFHQYMNSQINQHMLADQARDLKSEEMTEGSDEMNDSSERDYDHEGELMIAEYPESQEFKTEGEEDPLKASRSGKLESRQTCPYCQRKFPWVSSLRRHLITHTGLKPYECPHCGATFSTKSNCERHINRRHQGQKEGEENEGSEILQRDPFKCRECLDDDVAFSTRRKLQKHYKEDHPSAAFPQEYMEAPDVIVNNKDLIEKIQQGYDPVLSPSITTMVPEGTKKRNQLFFGSNVTPLIKQEPLDPPSADESSSSIHSQSFLTTDELQEQQQSEGRERRDFLEEMSFQELEKPNNPTPERNGDTAPSMVKEEQGSESGNYTSIIEKPREYTSCGEEGGDGDDSVSGLRLGESFSDRGISEGEEGEANSDEDDDSHISGDLLTEAPTMVGDLSSAAALRIPQVTITPRRGKKGARFNCEQCCKKFKTEQTLVRHLKVHQLEHPFKCTECTATFTTKFNCQRHIMKLHGKSKEEVVNITGCGKVVESRRLGGQASPSPAKKLKVSPSLYTHSGLHSSSSMVKGLGSASSMVKILPKHHHHRSSSSSSHKKNHSKKKIKNILPKPEQSAVKWQAYAGEGMSAYSGDRLTNGQLDASQNGIGGVQSVYSQDGNGPVWGYSYVEAPTGMYSPSGVVAPSVQEDVGESGGIGNSDIIKDLLGIQDSSTMDQLLESADSAAKILGLQG